MKIYSLIFLSIILNSSCTESNNSSKQEANSNGNNLPVIPNCPESDPEANELFFGFWKGASSKDCDSIIDKLVNEGVFESLYPRSPFVIIDGTRFRIYLNENPCLNSIRLEPSDRNYSPPEWGDKYFKRVINQYQSKYSILYKDKNGIIFQDRFKVIIFQKRIETRLIGTKSFSRTGYLISYNKDFLTYDIIYKSYDEFISEAEKSMEDSINYQNKMIKEKRDREREVRDGI